MNFETRTAEQFAAMNDAEFDAFWAAQVEAVQAEATCEADFEAVEAARAKAEAERNAF